MTLKVYFYIEQSKFVVSDVQFQFGCCLWRQQGSVLVFGTERICLRNVLSLSPHLEVIISYRLRESVNPTLFSLLQYLELWWHSAHGNCGKAHVVSIITMIESCYICSVPNTTIHHFVWFGRTPYFTIFCYFTRWTDFISYNRISF